MVPDPQHKEIEQLCHPGESIAYIIEDKGISQKELAIRTGFTEKHISAVINGEKSISDKLAIALEKVLEIPYTALKQAQLDYNLQNPIEALSENDQEEIENAIRFKKRLKDKLNN